MYKAREKSSPSGRSLLKTPPTYQISQAEYHNTAITQLFYLILNPCVPFRISKYYIFMNTFLKVSSITQSTSLVDPVKDMKIDISHMTLVVVPWLRKICDRRWKSLN